MLAEGRSSSVVSNGWAVEPWGGEGKIYGSSFGTRCDSAPETKIRMGLEVVVWIADVVNETSEKI